MDELQGARQWMDSWKVDYSSKEVNGWTFGSLDNQETSGHLNELDKVGQCKQLGQRMILGSWPMDEHGELDNGSIQGSGTISEVPQWMNSWKVDNGTF
jgi:hypothetical protein